MLIDSDHLTTSIKGRTAAGKPFKVDFREGPQELDDDIAGHLLQFEDYWVYDSEGSVLRQEAQQAESLGGLPEPLLDEDVPDDNPLDLDVTPRAPRRRSRTA